MNNTDALDPVKVEVIGSALSSICDEMGEALVKASYSPNIKERRDCTTCIFDVEGNALAQAEHIPLHLGSLMGIVDAVLARYPIEGIRDGDSFVGNDPHTGGGTHLPDIVLVTPIFIDGELIGWATNLAHHADYADRGHENIFQEGIRIPALRIVRDGEFIDDLMHMILTNMQVPSERIADFNAQLAANKLGVERVREVAQRYGVDILQRAGLSLLDYTERKVRAGIAELPDGVYEFSDSFDSDELDYNFDISVKLTIHGDSMDLDFDGPEQVRASINLVRTGLLATVYYAVKTVVGADIPANAGLYRPITVTAPEGSVLSCVSPAAVQGRTQLAQRVVDLVHGALAQADASKVIAACYGSVPATTFSGINPASGEYYVYLETIGGGLGASGCWDGLNGVQSHITNTSNLPIESLEAEYPLFVESYELVDGSGGAGKYRGGMGIHRRIRAEHDDCICDVSVSRVDSQPWGLEGGLPGAALRVELNDGIPVTQTVTRLNVGDAVSVFTAGGGGFGSPTLRNHDDVARDVREERITREEAVEVYGIDPSRLYVGRDSQAE